MKWRKNRENTESPETRTLEIPSFHHCCVIPLSEALGKSRCPCRWDRCHRYIPRWQWGCSIIPRVGGWGKQRTRAVASLEVRTRVVASVELFDSRECDHPIYCSSSQTPGLPGVRRALARFAQLAIGCSNPQFIFSEDERIDERVHGHDHYGGKQANRVIHEGISTGVGGGRMIEMVLLFLYRLTFG